VHYLGYHVSDRLLDGGETLHPYPEIRQTDPLVRRSHFLDPPHALTNPHPDRGLLAVAATSPWTVVLMVGITLPACFLLAEVSERRDVLWRWLIIRGLSTLRGHSHQFGFPSNTTPSSAGAIM
jgi:hypothetical protein